MCFICDRIKMINNGTNPYFVKELQTGYVVMAIISILRATHYFFAKNTKQNCFN